LGCGGEYPQWPRLVAQIKEIMGLFNQTEIAAKITRVGLRYTSFFSRDIFPDLLLRISVEDKVLAGEEIFLRTVLAGKNCKSLLQIQNRVALVTNPRENGSVIDIDSFITETPEKKEEFQEFLESFLEDAHQTQKDLFFSLLKPDFLQTLNPSY
jgi:uncharacterized protein (TIGR04255 family)